MILTIENSLTGLFANVRLRRRIHAIVQESATLDECEDNLRLQHLGPHLYRGGSHIAIHPTHRGRFVHGERLAIITDR